jgi:hypothetical protein
MNESRGFQHILQHHVQRLRLDLSIRCSTQCISASNTDGANVITNDSCVCLKFLLGGPLMVTHSCTFDTMVSRKKSVHSLNLDLNETSDSTKYTLLQHFLAEIWPRYILLASPAPKSDGDVTPVLCGLRPCLAV